MKKFYSLVAVAVAATMINAQVLDANFNDVDGTGGNDGVWKGNVAGTALSEYASGGTWALENAYKGDKALKMGTGSKQGKLTTPKLAGVLDGAKLTFRAGAWDGNNEKTTLKISAIGAGTLSESTVTLTKASFGTYTITINGGNDDTQIVFEGEAASNSRFFIDDIMVSNVTTAVADFKAPSLQLVQSTVVGNEILFKAKTEVKVYSFDGRIVKSASVSESKGLNVSDLNAGSYIVTGVVNNKMVSEKIIKK